MQAKKKTKRPIRVAAQAKASAKVHAYPIMADAGNLAAISARIDELARAHTEFRAANDEHLKALSAGRDDVVAREKVDRINATVGDLQKEIKAINDAITASRVGGGIGEGNADVAAHARAFSGFLRRGREEGLGDLQVRAALSTDSNPDGGYTVTTEMDAAITRVQTTVSAIRRIATVRTLSGSVYKKLHNKGGATSGWVGETSSRPETNTPKLSELAFTTGELYAMPAATQGMLDDSSLNTEGWLTDEVGIVFAEQEGAALANGDGVNKPKGIFSYDKVANASYAWGKLGFLATGTSGGFDATNPGDKLIDLIHSLNVGYRNNARFLMNDLTLASIRKFKDGEGNYLWQPGLATGEPSTLLGYSVELDDNVADIAANSYSLAFGDFARGYVVVDKAGVRVLRDPYTAKPYVLFYVTKRVGGGIQDFAAIKLLKFAA